MDIAILVLAKDYLQLYFTFFWEFATWLRKKTLALNHLVNAFTREIWKKNPLFQTKEEPLGISLAIMISIEYQCFILFYFFSQPTFYVSIRNLDGSVPRAKIAYF